MADEERIEKDKDPKPGQYVLYIPHGVMIAIPGDTVHAGGFCFGRKLACPSSIPGKENFLQNHCLHFIFCWLGFQGKETSIQIVADDEPPFVRDYAPDEEVLNSLLESVLDCHSDFIPIAAYNNPTRPSRKRKIWSNCIQMIQRKMLDLFHWKKEEMSLEIDKYENQLFYI